MAAKPKAFSPAAGPTYKPGYIVYLRSGGPEMAIESIEPNGDLNCVWFAMGGDKWEMPFRDRFVAPSVQFAVDGNLIDSRRGRFVDEDGELVPPEEPVESLNAEGAVPAGRPKRLGVTRKRF